MYIHMYMYMHIHMYMYMHIYMHMYMHIHMYMYMHIYTHMYMHIHMYMYSSSLADSKHVEGTCTRRIYNVHVAYTCTLHVSTNMHMNVALSSGKSVILRVLTVGGGGGGGPSLMILEMIGKRKAAVFPEPV